MLLSMVGINDKISMWEKSGWWEFSVYYSYFKRV